MGHIHPGDFIGEMGVLIACVRNGTTRILKDSSIEEYSRAEFLKLIGNTPELSTKLLHALSLRTRAQMELFHKLPPSSLKPKPIESQVSRFQRWCYETLELANQFIRYRIKTLPFLRNARKFFPRQRYTKKRIAKGEVLFSLGDISENVFWVESGKVHVELKHENSNPTGFICAGEFLGEMGVLESLPRSATARATQETIVYVISPIEFFDLMKNSPNAYFTVLDSLCERARRLQRANHEKGQAESVNDVETGEVLRVASSIDSMAQLAEQRFLSEAQKMRQFLADQWEKGGYLRTTYQKYLKGEATREELEQANTYLRDYVKIAGIGTLFILPGGMLTIPIVAKIGKALGVDIFPSDSQKPWEEGK